AEAREGLPAPEAAPVVEAAARVDVLGLGRPRVHVSAEPLPVDAVALREVVERLGRRALLLEPGDRGGVEHEGEPVPVELLYGLLDVGVLRQRERLILGERLARARGRRLEERGAPRLARDGAAGEEDRGEEERPDHALIMDAPARSCTPIGSPSSLSGSETC